MGGTGSPYGTGETRLQAYEEKRPLGKPSRRWEDFKEVGLIYLSWDNALMGMLMNMCDVKNNWLFCLAERLTAGLLKQILLLVLSTHADLLPTVLSSLDILSSACICRSGMCMLRYVHVNALSNEITEMIGLLHLSVCCICS
jgi:hypothetical protein